MMLFEQPTADRSSPIKEAPAVAPVVENLLEEISAAPFDPRVRSHWWIHVIWPLGISLMVHILSLAPPALMLRAFGDSEVVEAEEPSFEYEARVIKEGADEPLGGSFRFPGNAMVDRPDAGPKMDTKTPGPPGLAELARQAAASPIPQPLGMPSLLKEFTGQDSGRSDIIGVGAGGGASFGGGGDGGFGDRDVAGGGPIGGLWGVGKGQRAKSVVFVVDRSGSFIDWMEAIDLELKRSIGLLQQDQSFNVIFLRDNQPLALQPRLIDADETGKRQAFTWINMNPPSGGSNLTPAVRAALRFTPEVLFIVTDYALLSSPVESTNIGELLNSVRSVRKKKPMTVNVILMGPFDRPKLGAETLRRQLAKPKDLTPEKEGMLREQLDLLETIDAIERLPRETKGTLQYLNGDALMDEWRRTHSRR